MDATGYIIYTPGGYMSAQIMQHGRRRLELTTTSPVLFDGKLLNAVVIWERAWARMFTVSSCAIRGGRARTGAFCRTHHARIAETRIRE